MIIEFLIASALEMSLPEFQPLVDDNGNVIVSELDDVTGDIIASEISFEEINIEDISSNERTLEGLSLEAVSDDDVIGYEIPILRSIETHTVNASVKSNYRVNSGKIGAHSGDNLYYVYLTEGIEYTLSSTSGMFWALSLNKDEAAHSYSSSTFIPSQNLYLVKNNSSFYVTYTTGTPDDEPDVSGDDVSGDTPSNPDVSGDDTSGNEGGNISADLSGIESKLDNVILLQRSILFVLLISFLYPIILSCVKNLKGDKNV